MCIKVRGDLVPAILLDYIIVFLNYSSMFILMKAMYSRSK